MQINFFKREVSCKLVFYGPGMSGKTTNLQIISEKTPDSVKSPLTSIATEGDRTLFFDYMPLNLGKIGGMDTKFQLYTVPGQIYYNSTRKLVLQGVDGIVFVADSQKEKLKENIESFINLEENLKEYGFSIHDIPIVIQWNKRDLPSALEINFLEKNINTLGLPTTEAIAATGNGVVPTLKLIASMVLDKLNRKQSGPSPVKPSSAQKTKPPAVTKEVDKNVAVVNGVNISESYFRNYCQLQYRLYTKDRPVEDFKRFSADKKESMLEQLINHYLAIQESKELGIRATKNEIEGKMEQYKKKIGSEEKLNLYLSGRKLTIDNFRNEIIKNLIINKLIKTVIPDHRENRKLNDKELAAYYKKHSSRFRGSFEANKERIMLILNKERLTQELFQIVRRESTIKKNL